MGYLNPQFVTVDAILTTLGRSMLAQGNFKITQFSLGDDEIDYSQYNPAHPSGSAFFGEAIQNMPVLEAFPDETQIMRYKLVTLPRGTSVLPVINIGYNLISLKQGASLVITPQTLNYNGSVSTFEPDGYAVTVNDARVLSTFTGIGIDTSNIPANSINVTAGTSFSQTQIGTSFTIVGTTINTLFGTNQTTITTTLTVVGRDSGARINIPLQIVKNQ